MEGFCKLFPFWSKDQIRRLLTKLTESGVIIKGSFNKNSFDRTSWYAFKDEKKWIKEYIESRSKSASGEIAKSKKQNRQIRSGEIAKSYIYNNNKDLIKDTKEDIDVENIKEFLDHRKDLKCPMSSIAIAKLKNRLRKLEEEGYDPAICIDHAIMNGWKSVHGVEEAKKSDKTPHNEKEPPKYIGQTGFINPDWSMWEAKRNANQSSNPSLCDSSGNGIQQASDRRAIEHLAGSVGEQEHRGNPFNVPEDHSGRSPEG
tara:strand:- start:807 stop:1580 length:774 start_codon:yes stop_codon:yes gene_type:complete